MDRNLGAYSVTGTEATLYQYGRKDPFSNANALYVGGEHKDTYRAWYSYLTRNEAGAKNNDVIAYAIQHPDAYITGSGAAGWLQTRDQTLWGDPDGWSEKYALEMSSFSGAKTAYDPCPAGYRVPNVWSFTGFTIDGKYANMMIGNINLLDQAWNGGWLLKGYSEDTEGVFFPGTGYWITYKYGMGSRRYLFLPRETSQLQLQLARQLPCTRIRKRRSLAYLFRERGQLRLQSAGYAERGLRPQRTMRTR